jgi:membrane protein implicated in regulation of membrane protease activity
MTALYIGAFIAGLFAGVAIMLYGIERRPAAGTAPAPSAPRHWLPIAGAFAAGFGIAGYGFSRVLAARGALIAAIATGLAATAFTRWLVAKSEAMPVEHDVDDERYVLQGHVAEVVSSISPGSEGLISFEYSNERRTLRARSLDDTAVSAGTEVVIERIEGDVAYVEPWLQVEQRL